MEEDLALLISKTYIGDLVTSDNNDQANFVIDVKRINSLIVLIQFKYQNQVVSFRAMLSRQKEGILFRIQEKISGDHLLKGVSGFLYGKPNIHGGFINQLNGFYFHVGQSYFDHEDKDMYFLGKTYRRNVESKQEVVLSQLTTV
ncbi:MAG: hypothetical protein R8G66_32715 [Cytophagales bacterium]|nr:hypothetical protein [Cytophagales bacterium]